LMPEHQSIRNKLKDREKQHFWFWGVFLETLLSLKSTDKTAYWGLTSKYIFRSPYDEVMQDK